jgi:hypothetical protein
VKAAAGWSRLNIGERCSSGYEEKKLSLNEGGIKVMKYLPSGFN